MSVTITSCAPVKAFRSPGTAPQTIPPTMPPSSDSGTWMTVGMLIMEPTTAPPMPPMTACPFAPMLNRPAWNAMPTPMLMMTRGVA